MSSVVGVVNALFLSNKGESSRSILQKITLDQNGVLGDKFYAKDISRSVLLTSMDSYNLTQQNGISVDFGLLGENILMDFNPYNLKIGTHIQIGNALLEISQNCTICNHLSAIDKKLPKLLKNSRGIFAKVIKGADISVGDKIIIL